MCSHQCYVCRKLHQAHIHLKAQTRSHSGVVLTPLFDVPVYGNKPHLDQLAQLAGLSSARLVCVHTSAHTLPFRHYSTGLGLSRYQNYDFDTIPAKISRYPILTIRYHKYDTIPQIRYDTGIFIYDSNKQNICKVPFFTSLFLPSFLNT